MAWQDGEGKQLKPSNLETLYDDAAGVVHCVWGDAQWSRTQLLGEIARGHWGLCRASVAEMVVPPAERWSALDGRLVFAPESEMMEDFIKRGVAQMEREAALQARAATAQTADDVGEQEDEPSATAEGMSHAMSHRSDDEAGEGMDVEGASGEGREGGEEGQVV